MKTMPRFLPGVLFLAFATSSLTLAPAAGFTRLTPLPAARIVASAEEYPGDSYKAGRLVDGNAKTEFASNGKGTNTFVEFDFGAPVRLGGLCHQDRNDPATVAASELALIGADGRPRGADHPRLHHRRCRGDAPRL